MCHTTPVLANTCLHLLYYNLSMPCTKRFTTSHTLSNIERGTPRLSNRCRYCVECFVERRPGFSDRFVLFKLIFIAIFKALGLSAVESTFAFMGEPVSQFGGYKLGGSMQHLRIAGSKDVLESAGYGMGTKVCADVGTFNQ